MPAGAQSFDYIVTGAGAVAARLSESGQYPVLLLEAGGKDRNSWIHIPLGFSQVYADPRVNWMYASEPEVQLGGRKLYQPHCKVLSGTSSINGMVYEDFNYGRQEGAGYFQSTTGKRPAGAPRRRICARRADAATWWCDQTRMPPAF